MLVTRLQMGLLIFSSEGKVERQMGGNDAVGREQLRLRRLCEPTASFHCISTPEVKWAGLKRNQADSGTNKQKPDSITGAIKAEFKHLCDPGEMELVTFVVFDRLCGRLLRFQHWSHSALPTAICWQICSINKSKKICLHIRTLVGRPKKLAVGKFKLLNPRNLKEFKESCHDNNRTCVEFFRRPQSTNKKFRRNTWINVKKKYTSLTPQMSGVREHDFLFFKFRFYLKYWEKPR